MTIIHPNVRAFLDTIAWAEGTDRPEIQRSNMRGYDVQVGGALVLDLTKHPGTVVRVQHGKMVIHSSACGRYQFLHRIWKTLAKRLGLKDFGPESQDRACIELLRECGALPLIVKGEFVQAVKAACRIWASLPGAGYKQHEQRMDKLVKVYVQKGGTLA